MKCNQCKNPVQETDSVCEWCGSELVIYQSQDENHPLKKLQIDLQALESKERDRMQLKIDNHNGGVSTFDKLFGQKILDWDDDVDEQLNERINKLQAKFLNTYILPSNPKVLQELAEMASENYKLNKPNVWSDDSDELTESKKFLSDAWYNLMNRSQRKLGIKDERNTFAKIYEYVSRSPNLKLGLIVFFFYTLLFLIIGVLKYFE